MSPGGHPTIIEWTSLPSTMPIGTLQILILRLFRTMAFLDRLHEAGVSDDDVDDGCREPISGRGDALIFLVGCSAWLVAISFAIELFWLRYG